MATSADKNDRLLRLAIAWGLIGLSPAVVANEEELPDVEFLEYLGSWEGSEADWLLFHDGTGERVAGEKSEPADPGPAEESMEPEDES